MRRLHTSACTCSMWWYLQSTTVCCCTSGTSQGWRYKQAAHARASRGLLRGLHTVAPPSTARSSHCSQQTVTFIRQKQPRDDHGACQQLHSDTEHNAIEAIMQTKSSGTSTHAQSLTRCHVDQQTRLCRFVSSHAPPMGSPAHFRSLGPSHA